MVNSEYASIETYYNEDNFLCNKISIKDLDKDNLNFKNDEFINWVEIRTEFGFIREYN